MFRKKTPEKQQSMWLPTADIVMTPAGGFYQKLDEALKSFGFGDRVRALCEPFYCADKSVGGRPGIDPEVYFKMLLIGFFENIPSERGIAARCGDSLSIRQFLHYELTESTPHHSSFTRIRQRLHSQVYREVFGIVLSALKKNGLLKGKHLGIDSSIIEANASLRTIEHRLSGEEYWQYVKKLAAEAGVDPENDVDVRRFDRKRSGRKTSNDDWQNPNDPDAKIGRTKRGSTRMVYKPEHLVDLDTGAIVDADVRPGDEHDANELAERVLDTEERMNTATGQLPDACTIETVTSDKGYYTVRELVRLRHYGIKPIISDPIDNRRIDKLSEEERAAVGAAKRSATSKRGKTLLRRRGQHVERSFEHVLDQGGARRTTLRGRENITKRYVIQAMGYNLSLLMRVLLGVGTPKQALAIGFSAIQGAIAAVFAMLGLLITVPGHRRLGAAV